MKSGGKNTLREKFIDVRVTYSTGGSGNEKRIYRGSSGDVYGPFGRDASRASTRTECSGSHNERRNQERLQRREEQSFESGTGDARRRLRFYTDASGTQLRRLGRPRGGRADCGLLSRSGYACAGHRGVEDNEG